MFCDQSLREHAEVLPAGGAPDAAIRNAPERLALLAGAEWVDVARRSLPPPSERFAQGTSLAALEALD